MAYLPCFTYFVTWCRQTLNANARFEKEPVLFYMRITEIVFVSLLFYFTAGIFSATLDVSCVPHTYTLFWTLKNSRQILISFLFPFVLSLSSSSSLCLAIKQETFGIADEQYRNCHSIYWEMNDEREKNCLVPNYCRIWIRTLKSTTLKKV